MPGTPAGRPGRSSESTFSRRLHRVFHVRNRFEFGIPQLAVLLLDLADIDVLDDVAGVRVDRDRAPRAFPRHPFHGADERVAIDRARGLPQRLIDDVHSVVAADREKVCPHAIVCFADAVHEGPVLLGRMRRRVKVSGHRAEHDVAHVVQGVVVGEVAGTEQPDPRLVEPALDELPHQRGRLTGRDEHEKAVGRRVARPLQERCEIRVLQRNSQRFDHLPTRPGKAVLEEGLGIVAGSEIGNHADDFLHAVPGLPISDHDHRLRLREARADDIGGAFGDDGRRRCHHDHRRL